MNLFRMIAATMVGYGLCWAAPLALKFHVSVFFFSFSYFRSEFVSLPAIPLLGAFSVYPFLIQIPSLNKQENGGSHDVYSTSKYRVVFEEKAFAIRVNSAVRQLDSGISSFNCIKLST